MKTVLGRQGRGWLMVAAGLVLLCLPLLGMAAETTDGQVSRILSQNLYCDVRGLVEGNVGLLLGLILTTMGLWNLIHDGSIPGAITLMITGALITSIPTLLESTFRGVGALLEQTQMSSTPFAPPFCRVGQGSGGISGGDTEARELFSQEAYRQKLRAAGHQDFYSPF